MTSNLSQAAKDLLTVWQQTKSSWRDAKCQEFEHTYIEALPNHVTQALTAIEKIDLLIKKIRSDCE